MSTTRNTSKQLRALLSDGKALSETEIDHIVKLDEVDRQLAAGKTPKLSPQLRSALSQLLHAEHMGWLYFLSATEVARIKIGMTHDCTRSVGFFRAQSPIPITVLAIVRCPADFEGALQRALANCRSHGEWFNATPDLLDLVEDIQRRRFRAIHEFVHRQGVYNPKGIG